MAHDSDLPIRADKPNRVRTTLARALALAPCAMERCTVAALDDERLLSESEGRLRAGDDRAEPADAGSLVGRWFFDVVDDEDIDGSPGRFELQP